MTPEPEEEVEATPAEETPVEEGTCPDEHKAFVSDLQDEASLLSAAQRGAASVERDDGKVEVASLSADVECGRDAVAFSYLVQCKLGDNTENYKSKKHFVYSHSPSTLIYTKAEQAGIACAKAVKGTSPWIAGADKCRTGNYSKRFTGESKNSYAEATKNAELQILRGALKTFYAGSISDEKLYGLGNPKSKVIKKRYDEDSGDYLAQVNVFVDLGEFCKAVNASLGK